MNPNRLVDVATTAAALKISERAVRKQIKQGKLRAEKVPIKKAPGWEWRVNTDSWPDAAKVAHYKRYTGAGGQEPGTEETSLPLEPEHEINEFDAQPQYKKDEAFRWVSIIEQFEAHAKKSGRRKRCKAGKDFVLHYRIDHPDEKHFTWQTLFKKFYALREHGIMGLVNKYGKTRNFAPWPKEARAWLKLKYLNINQPTATWCIDQLKAEAGQKGWDLPSDATLRRFLERIPREEKDYFRKGKKYWREHHVPSVLRDYESMAPGELYVSDHQQINVAVRHPSGGVIFPWFTGWMDMRCRKILCWTIAKTPSGDTVNLSLKHTIERFGAPEHVIIDNGRDFSAKRFTGGQKKRFRFKVKEDEITGIYKMLGIEPHFCIPANAQAKNIERWFWTQEINFQKAFSTYRGNNVLNRPEGVDDRIKSEQNVLEWDEFESCLENYIENYNQDHHHRGHGMDGRTPNEMWNEHFEAHAQRRVSPSSLRLLMMKSKAVKVGRFGISAFGSHYRSDTVMDHQGSQIIYRYDPSDFSIIYIYSLKNEFICTAPRRDRTAWNDENAYGEIKRLEKRRERAIKEEREADDRLAQVQFGYTPREPSGEHKDKPAKVVRVLRTPLDGVQKEIEQEEERAAACAGGDDFGARFLDALAADRDRRERRAAPVRSFMRLTIDDPRAEED